MTDEEIIIKYFEEEPPVKVTRVKHIGEDLDGNSLYEVTYKEEDGNKYQTEVGIVKNYGVIVLPE